jgi:hypothetical protein
MSIMPEDWIARGYRRHEVSESRREMNKLADFILQKRIDDEKGKKYYITVYCYDRRRYPYPHNEMGDPFGFMASVHFALRDGKPFFNIEMNAVKGIDDVEAAYEGFWNHLGRPYYETWEEA